MYICVLKCFIFKLLMLNEKTKLCSTCDIKSDCFRELSLMELELADTRRVELKYRKGENIAKQGSFVTHILYIQKGLVKVYMEMDGDNDMILNIFSEGDRIGLTNLFSDTPLQYSVAAIEDSVICAIDKKVFESLIVDNGVFAQSLMEQINKCTFYHFRRLISASQKQLNGRMADALLHLSDDIYKSKDFDMVLSRKELAELAGMSMMSAVRVVKNLEQSGIISEQNGRLSIVDRTKLLEISKYG